MDFIIITGMSGAGKGQALKYLEDNGRFCIDNLPPALMPTFAELCVEAEPVKKAAMVIDIRSMDFLDEIKPNLDILIRRKHCYKIVFMDAADEVLVQRFKGNRRVHPLEDNGIVTEALRKERELLSPIKEMADYVIDTSETTLLQLKDEILKVANVGCEPGSLNITVLSFGYKYGNPIDCDLLFDVRFIQNPFYISHLSHKSGLDEEVKAFVLDIEITKKFIEKYMDMMNYLIPYYVKEGKNSLVIGIGCTGGRHRSVAIAEEIYRLNSEEGRKVIVEHRDISKDTLLKKQ